MSAMPEATVEIDEALLRRLLRDQAPQLGELSLAHVANGWDNAIWRLGSALAVRVTRRAIAAELHAHEQRWLPTIARQLPLSVPAPVVAGSPSTYFPWPWSVVPWFDGNAAAVTPPHPDEARTFGRFLAALHAPAPDAAPRNPVRGVPLAFRRRSVADWARRATTNGDGVLITAARRIFDAGEAVQPASERVWLHGDLHARNVLVSEGRLGAVIDWGDMTAGDAATDLAGLWWLFDLDAHRDFWSAYGDVSQATWHRARAWAALFGLSFLTFALPDSSETPDLRAQELGRNQLQRVVASQQPFGDDR